MWDCRFRAHSRDAGNTTVTMGAALIVIFSLCACGGGGQSSSFVPPSAAGAAQAAAPAQNAQSLTSSSWSNGQQIPAAFVDQAFGASGPFYQQLSENPQVDGNSANVISYYFAGNPQFSAGWIEGSSSQAQYDYNFPLYRASTSDPLVKIICTGEASCADGDAQIRIPASARQAGGTDHHLAVLESNGLEYDFWGVSSSPPYADGSTISTAGEAHFSLSGGSGGGTGYIAPGFAVGAATAGGNALSIGQVYTSELASGVIKHALSLTFPCGTSSWLYPSSQISGVCGSGQGMPLGSRVWWQPSDAQTNGLSIARDMKTILIALHHYGGFYTDSFGGTTNGYGKGMGTRLENQEQYWVYGNGFDPALAYAQSAGWNHITGGVDRYVLAVSGASIDLLDNLKVVAPCVTQGIC